MAANERPNFLFIFPDQWRADCLGTAGHPVVETPFLDELAAEGVSFPSAYSPCPTCISTRACLITGQTPSTCGRLGYQDGVPWRYEQTLMRCLRDGGYQTLLAGKTHFYPQRAALGFEEMRLYDTLAIDPDFKSDYRAWLDQQTGGAVRDSTLELYSNSMVVNTWTQPEHLHANSWNVTAAIDLLERRDPTRPFFLQLSFHRPHPPLDPPESYYQRYHDVPLPPVPVGDWAREWDQPVSPAGPRRGRLPQASLDRARRAYYAQLTHLDFQIGRMLHFLRGRKLLDSTYIIFMSDHGELLGDHLMYSKVNPLEGSARVPLIFRPPTGHAYPRGSQCALPVAHYDLMPTLLEEAGLTVPGTVEGRSLAALVRGEHPTWREFLHGEHAPNWQYVTDGREKFFWDSQSGREFFFDLVSDPQECHERAQDPACTARVALWRQRLVQALAQRPQDGLSDGERLLSGKSLPAVRQELLDGHVAVDYTTPKI